MLPFLMNNGSGTSSSQLADPPSPPILAGIEWEFLVPHTDGPDHHPDDTRWHSRPDPYLESLPDNPSTIFRRRMSPTFQTLAKVEDIVRSSTGLTVFSRLETHDKNTGMYVLQKNNVKQIDHVNWLYQAHSTSADSSLHARDPDSKQWMDMRYDWLGIELRSRVFEEKDLNQPSPRTAIATKEITSICTSLRDTIRLQINHSCALQVTVSHQSPGGLSLLSLKRILTLLWVLEPLIFRLCAPYRQTRKYCLPIRTCSELSAIPLNKLLKSQTNTHPDLVPDNYIPYWEQEFTAHIGAALSALHQPPNPTTTTNMNDLDLPLLRHHLLRHHLLHLWSANNAPTLGCLIRSKTVPYDRLSVAIKFLGDGPITNCLEFRMHEGTLDPTLTKLWVNFCVAVVKKATRLDKKGFGDLVSGFVAGKMMGGGKGSGMDASVVAMLRELDIPGEEIRLWGKKMSWWGERDEMDLVLPLPRPWVMDGLISGTGGGGSRSNGNGQAFKGNGKALHTSSEGSFLPRLGDDEHRLC